MVANTPIAFRRVDLQGYLIILLGLVFVIDNTRAILDTGTSLAEISGITLGLFAIGGGVYGYFKPESIPDGVEPAPTYLYILAGIATLAFVTMIIL